MDADLVKEMAPAVFKLMTENDCGRVLNDVREAEITKSAMELMVMSSSVTQAGFHQKHKRALVVKEYNKDVEFFETALRNRGHQLKVFIDMDEARDWLRNEDSLSGV